MSPEILENKRLANAVCFWPTAGRFVNKLCAGVFLRPIKGFKFSIMKKTNGTKLGTTFKRFITGNLVIATAMLFAFPGKVLAGDTVQNITVQNIPNKTYGDAGFKVTATTDSPNALNYAAQGPARIDSSGNVVITGAGDVKVFVYQLGDATYKFASVSKTFTIAKAAVTITAVDKTVVYDGNVQEIEGTAADVDGNALNTPTTTYVDAGNNAVLNPTNAGTYTATVSYSDDNQSGSKQVTLTVNKAPLTATLGNLSKVYDAANPSAGDWAGSLTFVPNDASAVDTTNLAVAYSQGGGNVAVGDAGSYVATPSGLTSSNYTITHAAGSLTVSKKAATVTLDVNSLTQTYTGNNLDPTAVTDPVGLNVTFDYGTATPKNAGSYAVTANIQDTNYTGSVDGTLTIGKATVIVTAANSGVNYDGNAKSITGTATDAANNALKVVTTYKDSNGATVASPTNAGTYTATAAVDDENHSGSKEATLTINKAALTATLGTLSKVYGTDNPSSGDWAAKLTYVPNVPSAVDTTNLTIAYSQAGNNVAVGDVGTYVATPSGLTSANYTITPQAGSLTVTKASTTVDLSALAGRSYTPTPITLAATAAGNRPVTYFVTGAATAVNNEVTLTGAGAITVVAFVEGTANYEEANDTETFVVDLAAANVSMSDVFIDYDNTVKSTVASAKDASGNNLDVTINITYKDASGVAVVNPKEAGVYTATANISDNRYEGSQTSTLTINKKAIDITITGTGVAHDGNEKPVSVQADDLGGNPLNVVTTYNGSATVPSAAGDYAVVSTINDANYKGTKNATLTIAKVDLDVSSVAYNGSNQEPKITLVPNDLTYEITYDALAAKPKNAKTYAAKLVVNDARYSQTIEKDFTILPATITITVKNASREYGEANPTFDADYTGFQAGDDESKITKATISTVANLASNAGTYAITAANASGDNYAFAYNDGELKITRAPLTITPEPKTKTYLDANPALTVTYSPFKNGEDNTVLDIQPVISTLADANSDVGTYDITVAGAVDTNYEIDQSAKGTLTVEKKAATVEIGNTTQTYNGGELLVSTTTSVNDLKVDVTYTLDGAVVASPTNAGTYAVLATINDTNYSGTTNGTLKIEKADATVTLGSLTQTYTGSPLGASAVTDPVGLTVDFTYSVVDPTDAGTYSVTGAIDNVNYKGSATSNAFVIGKAALTAAADNLTKVYGEANPAFTIDYTGFVGGDGASDLDTAPVPTTNADAASGVGEYDITLAAGSDNNYTITNTDGKLAVTKKTLTATAASLSKVYGVAVPAIGIAYDGFVNGDTLAVIDTAPTTTTLATATSPVVTGGYVTSAVGGSDDNYSFTYANGVLTVTKAVATLSITGSSQQYTGEPIPVTVTTNPSGLESGVLVTYDGSNAVPSALGTYAVEANLVDQNYSGTVAGNLIISKGDQSITFAHSGDVFYGVAPIDMGAKSSSGADVLIFVSGPAYVTGDGKVAVTDIGRVNVLGYEIGSGTWSDGISATSFNVKKQALTVTASTVSKVFGDSNPDISYTITGFAPGEGESALSSIPVVTTTADSNSNAGTYAITFATKAVDGSGRYEVDHVDGTLTVTPAPLTITAVDQSRIYGDENPDAPVINGLRVREYQGIEGGKVTDLTGNAKYPDGFDYQAVADYFEWPQSGDINEKPGNKADNYGIELAGYITPTETAEYQFHISSDDASELWLSTDESSGNLVKIATESNWNGVRNYPTDDRRSKVDVYELTVTGTADNSAANDSAAAALSTAAAADADAKAAVTAATTARDETAAALVVANEKAAQVDATQADKDAAVTAAAAVTTAEEALVTAETAVDTANQTLLDARVADANALLVVVDKTKALSDAKAGGDADAIAAATSEYTAATTAWADSTAEVTTAEAGLATANADVTAKEIALTEAKAASDAAAAKAAIVAATDEDIAAAVTAKTAADTAAANLLTALQNQADAATALATAQATYDATTAGTAAVVAGQIVADINAKTQNSNAVTAVADGGVITITAKEPNIPITITASASNRAVVEATYYVEGDELPEGKAVGDVKTPAVAGGEDDTQKVVVETTTASAEGVAQVTTLTISGRIETGDSLKLNITGGRNENVSEFITLVAGQSYYVKALMKEGGGGDNFAVAWIKKGEAAPAADALPIPGDVLTPASSITYTYAGLKLNQTGGDLTTLPTGTIDVSPTSNIGDYDIVIGGAESANYDITHVNGKLTINPATLTVTAANKEVFESLALPELTYAYSGFMNGEDDTIVTTHSSISTDADNAVPGDYAIVVTGAVAPNYTINNVNGNMKIKTVGKAKVTGLAVSKANALEGDKVTFTATSTGDLLTYEWFLGSDKIEGVTGNTLTLNDVTLDQAGRVQVFASNFKGKARKLGRLKVSERLNQVLIAVGSDPVIAKNIIKSTDTVTGSSTNTPGAEGVEKAIDNDSSTKYLNFDKVNTGLTVTTSGGVVSKLALTSANDAPERDPSKFILSGSNDGGTTFEEIASGDIPSFASRFERKVIDIANTKEYITYKLDFPTVANESAANSMQIADIELIDTRPSEAAKLDIALADLIKNQGYSTIMEGPAYDSIDIDSRHFAFVVISSTLGDSDYAAKYKNTTAPIINMSGSSQDDLGFVGNVILTGSILSGSEAVLYVEGDEIPEGKTVGDVKTPAVAASINIADASHALAGGLAAGSQDIATAVQVINWGMPNGNANVIATIGDTDKAAIYAYEVGVGMGGGIDAAGRRVHLHTTTDGLATATTAGSSLISAAVNWVMEFDILGSGGDLDLVEGESLVLDGRAVGENIVVQWYKDGVAIDGGSSLDLGVLEQGDAGTYTIKATDPDAPWVKRFKEISYVVSVSKRGPEAVLVTSSSDLTASDAIIKSKLEGKGYYVIQSDAADTYATDVEGKTLVVISPSAATSGEIVFNNTGTTTGAFFATTKEFGDQVELGLNNRLIDSLSFEYFGDFTADGDETAIARIYANDGDSNGAANKPGTLLYESDSFTIVPGFNSVVIGGLLLEATDSITWTVDFNGVGDVEGNRAGLIFYNPPSVGSSDDDFWVNNTNSREIIYSNSHGSVYEAYYKSGSEFGDQIRLSSTSAMSELSFEVYAEISNAPSEATAKLRIYANDGDTYLDTDTKQPGTLLFESGSIALKEGYHTYTVSDIDAVLPRDITWTVEFGGITGDELTVGNNAALILAGIDGIGTSNADFWQKTGATWTTYVTNDANDVNDFSANVVKYSAGSGGWSTYTVANAEIVNNFGAKVTAGIEDDLLTSANVPMVVLNPGFQSHVRYTGTGEGDSGTASGSKITVVNADHGLAGGLSGDVGLVTLGNGDAGIGWGVPQGDVEIVATLVGDGEKAAIYGYQEGAVLADGNAAPERRSFVFATDELLGKADANALKLIDSAIDWTGGTGFLASPNSAELLEGETVTLSAEGYGPGDVTYQWKKNGSNIDGATGTSLILESVAKDAAANYSVVVTSAGGATAEATASVKVYNLPAITLVAPLEGSTTSAVTHQVKIRAVGGADRIDAETISIAINGVDVTENMNLASNIRGVQVTADLVENTNTDTIKGVFLGYEDLAPGENNGMQVTMSFEVIGGARVLTKQWSYTLYDSSQTGGDGSIAKMAVNQIFQRGNDLYVVWPGSPGLMLERNSDCKGGVWEPLPNTVGRGLHVEPNCGTQAFFRLVRVKE